MNKLATTASEVDAFMHSAPGNLTRKSIVRRRNTSAEDSRRQGEMNLSLKTGTRSDRGKSPQCR